MKRCSNWITFGLLLFFPWGLYSQDLSKLKFEKHLSEKGGYSVSFPGKPASQTKKVKAKDTEIDLHLDLVQIGDDLVFIVSYCDYPEAMTKADPMKVVKAVCEGNKGTDGVIEKDEEIKNVFGEGKATCREVIIKKPEGIYMKSTIILKGKRLYQVMVVGKEAAVKSNEVATFHKSFQLTN